MLIPIKPKGFQELRIENYAKRKNPQRYIINRELKSNKLQQHWYTMMEHFRKR